MVGIAGLAVFVVLMVATILFLPYLLREPIAYLERQQTDLFDRLGGIHAKTGAWYTFSFTAFLLAGRFREFVEDDVVLMKFTIAMWWVRVFYALAAITLVLIALQ